MIIKLSSFLTIYDDDSFAAELKKPLKLPILLLSPLFFLLHSINPSLIFAGTLYCGHHLVSFYWIS